MLTIRPDQANVFRHQAVNSFINRVLQLFRAEFPDDFKGTAQDDIHEEIKIEIEKALRFGLQTESEVLTFLWATKFIGRDFAAAYPEADYALSEQHTLPAIKAQWLQEWALSLLEKR